MKYDFNSVSCDWNFTCFAPWQENLIWEIEKSFFLPLLDLFWEKQSIWYSKFRLQLILLKKSNLTTREYIFQNLWLPTRRLLIFSLIFIPNTAFGSCIAFPKSFNNWKENTLLVSISKTSFHSLRKSIIISSKWKNIYIKLSQKISKITYKKNKSIQIKLEETRYSRANYDKHLRNIASVFSKTPAFSHYSWYYGTFTSALCSHVVQQSTLILHRCLDRRHWNIPRMLQTSTASDITWNLYSWIKQDVESNFWYVFY